MKIITEKQLIKKGFRKVNNAMFYFESDDERTFMYIPQAFALSMYYSQANKTGYIYLATVNDIKILSRIINDLTTQKL